MLEHTHHTLAYTSCLSISIAAYEIKIDLDAGRAAAAGSGGRGRDGRLRQRAIRIHALSAGVCLAKRPTSSRREYQPRYHELLSGIASEGRRLANRIVRFCAG